MNDEIKNNGLAEEDEIDLIALAKSLWDKRGFIVKTVIVFAVVGVVIALISPNQYTATTKMVPQVSSGNSKMGGLSSLATMAGINLNLNRDITELMPQTYPQVMQSAPFQLQLMYEKLQLPGITEPVSLYEYYTEYHKPGILSEFKKYTIGLPVTLLNALRGKKADDSEIIFTGEGTIVLTGEQEDVRKIISGNLSLDINDRDGYLQLNSSFPDPVMAARVAHKAQQLLQFYITEFKIEKATAQLRFIEERHNEKKREFDQAQIALAEFRDRNKNVTNAMALTHQEQLQNEYRLAFEVYSSLAQQLEQSRIQVKEDTPVFAIIQPVVVPHERSRPKRAMILAIWTFLGGVVAVGWVFGQQYIASTREQWNNSGLAV
jgi:uncharacterized protein involved in exopolysaccharide biosynthesis